MGLHIAPSLALDDMGNGGGGNAKLASCRRFHARFGIGQFFANLLHLLYSKLGSWAVRTFAADMSVPQNFVPVALVVGSSYVLKVAKSVVGFDAVYMIHLMPWSRGANKRQHHQSMDEIILLELPLNFAKSNTGIAIIHDRPKNSIARSSAKLAKFVNSASIAYFIPFIEPDYGQPVFHKTILAHGGIQ